MTHTDETQIRRNTIISTLSLFFQSGYSAGLGLAANLVLTVLLSPTIFGIYITVLSIIAVLNYFSDIGLAASLIQKKEISADDIKTTFTVQQLLIISIVTLFFFLTQIIKNFYNLPPEGVYLYWALLFAFFISSLKTIPSVFLERKIQFQKIVLVQIIENTTFYISVIIFALFGLGIHSFTIAVLLRAIVGLVAIYTFSFWRPTIGISISSLKQLLSFGLPFQATSFLALFKDELIILFLSKMVGFTGVGYIGWAKKWAEAAIRIVMDNIGRVMFPLIARYQHDKEKISGFIEKVLYYQSAIIIPALFGMVLVMGDLVTIIPKYGKWSAALPLFYVFSFSSLMVSFGAPFMNLFNALGKVKISFSFMIFWTILTWALTPLLTNKFGYYGFPIAHVIVSSSYIFVILKAKKVLNFKFFPSVFPFLYSSIIMAVGVLITKYFFPQPSLPSVIIQIAIGAALYIFSVSQIFHINLITLVISLKKKT